MIKQNITTLVAVFFCCLVLALSVIHGLASDDQTNGVQGIDWDVIGGGGGIRNQSAPYTLDGTIGQALVGVSVDTELELCSGFWCRVIVAPKKVYLPYLPQNY